MGLALLDLYSAPEATPTGEPEPRVVTADRVLATLRWRARWTLRRVPPRLAQALRLVHLLLATTTTHRSLRGDAPGIPSRLRPTPLARVAREFGLPPPGTQSRRHLVRALLVLPTRDGAELRVCFDRDATEHDRAQVKERVDRILAFLVTQNVRLHVGYAAYRPFSEPSAERSRLTAFAGLLAGTIDPPGFPPPATLGCAEDLLALAEQAPTDLSRLGLFLLASQPSPADAALTRLLAHGGTRDAAHPDRFVDAWLSGHPEEATFARAVELAGPFQGGVRDPRARARELLEVGRTLGIACIRSVRRATFPGHPARDAVRREALVVGVPEALRAALAGALRESAGSRPLAIELPVREPSGLATVSAAGIVLARHKEPHLALARAVALAVRVLGAAPSLAFESPAWRTVTQICAQRRREPLTFLLVEARNGQAEPADPLNSGPTRACLVSSARALHFHPQRSPTQRVLATDRLATEIVTEARRGAPLLPLATSPLGEPAAARVARLAQFALTPSTTDLGLECGGRVTLLGDHERRFPTARVALRPRRFDADPDAPDLPFATARQASAAPGAVHVRLSRTSQGHALVTYTWRDGWHLAEEIPVLELAAHIADTEALVRGAGSALLLVADRDIAQAVRLAGTPEVPVTEVRVTGHSPRALALELCGERFGAGSPLGWRAAAEALTSSWPPGVRGLVRVRKVTLEFQADALLRLWVRSVARRRIHAHVTAALAA